MRFTSKVLVVAAALSVSFSAAQAATVSFFNDGTSGATATSTGLRFDITCWNAGMTLQVDCSGALLDVNSPPSGNIFDTNAADGLVGDMTNNSNVDGPDPGSGASPAEELAFVQNYIGDPTLDWNGINDTKDGGGMSSFSFVSTAQYFVFTVGRDPRYALLRNDSGAPVKIVFQQMGSGAGLSHYAEFGVIPLPASGLLLLGGLGGLAALRRRKKNA